MKKLIFLGTPDLSVTILKSLIDAGYEIPLVITSPDKPIGRKQIITPTPVKVFTESKNLKVITPEKLGEEVLEEITNSGAELGIVVAYGKIIPQKIIDALPKGLLNIHYSLLPEFRGASPVESAILADKKETGVTIQKLVFKLDAGPIVAVEKLTLDNQITTPELKEKLTEIGRDLLIKILPEYINGKIIPIEQDESKATRCGKIQKADGEIKDGDTDKEKWIKYRAFLGWPGIFYFDNPVTGGGEEIHPHTKFSHTQNNNRNIPGQNHNLNGHNNQKVGVRVKITEAKFENEKFIIKKIIPEGKKEISL